MVKQCPALDMHANVQFGTLPILVEHLTWFLLILAVATLLRLPLVWGHRIDSLL